MEQGLTNTEQAIQFLSLFVPAVIAVVGSYFVYRKQRSNKKEALRTAIRTEIESADRLDFISRGIDEDGRLYYGSAVPTSLYEGHSFELGLLSEKEREAIVGYYSSAVILNNALDMLKDFELNEEDLPSNEYENMRWQLDRVRGLRKSALIHLDSDEVPEDTDFD